MEPEAAGPSQSTSCGGSPSARSGGSSPSASSSSSSSSASGGRGRGAGGGPALLGFGRAIAAAKNEEREQRVATKLQNYRTAVEVGKGHLERDHEGRKLRWQQMEEGGHEEALSRLGKEEERRLIASCKVWTTADFEALCVLGEGTFGTVHLVRLQGTEEHYALKQMKKAAYRQKNHRDRVRAERDLLAERQSRWFVKLVTTFQDGSHVYMVMEFLQGGDLVHHLDKKGRFSLEETCFYMAELLEALDTVHRCGLVHRDVKPDNIVLAASGHLKLLDFGLCCHTARPQAPDEGGERGSAGPPAGEEPRRGAASPRPRRRLQSVVGTPLYIAPEVFKGAYGSEADLWALGVITFECLAGRPLFDVDEEAVGAQAILGVRRQIAEHERVLSEVLQEARDFVSPSAEQLLLGLVCDVAAPRLSAAECREEPFFAGLDFSRLHLMQPPLKPEVAGPADARHFGGGGRRRELPAPRPSDLMLKDRALEWAHYEFDSRAHGGPA